jgi:hypothetical protein
MKKIYFLLFFLIVFCASLWAQKISMNFSIDTSYSYSISIVNLFLLDDGRFVNRNEGGGCFSHGVDSVVGYYEWKDKTLLLHPKTEFHLKFYNGMVGYRRDSILYQNSQNPLLDTIFQRIYWNNYDYLITDSTVNKTPVSRNGFIEFANFYNAQDTFKNNCPFYKIATPITTQSIKKSQEKIDKKQMPKHWRSYFLEKPIITRINTLLLEDIVWQELDIEKHRLKTYFEIDKGYKDGLRKGMLLYYRNGNDYTIYLTEVSKSKSIGLLDYFYGQDDLTGKELLNVNDTLSTSKFSYQKKKIQPKQIDEE